MEVPNFRIETEDYEKIVKVLDHVHARCRALSVYLINRNGQDVAHAGDSNGIDIQALASLAASNMAATFGLAALIGEGEFQRIYHRGLRSSILITPISDLALILVIMSATRHEARDLTSLRQASMILEEVLRRCGKE